MDQATSRCDDGKNIKTRRIWQRTDCKVRDRPKLAQNRFHISFKPKPTSEYKAVFVPNSESGTAAT
ncbi:hypothetical protein Plhal304r1_c018g0064881 [Plasmopara halstedii]